MNLIKIGDSTYTHGKYADGVDYLSDKKNGITVNIKFSGSKEEHSEAIEEIRNFLIRSM